MATATVESPPLNFTPSYAPRPSADEQPYLPPPHDRVRAILLPIIFVLVVGAVSVSLVVLWLYVRRRNRKRMEGYPGWQLHRGMANQPGSEGSGVQTEGYGGGVGGTRVQPAIQEPAVVEAFAPVRVSGPAQARPVTQAFAAEHYAPVARDSPVARAPPVVVTDPPPKVSYG